MDVNLRPTRLVLLGLTGLLCLSAFELLSPGDRPLWLLVSGAAMLGTVMRPAAAALLGWGLVLLLAAYLIVRGALGVVNGAGWLTTLLVPWLPMMTSAVVEHVRRTETRRLELQRVLDLRAELNPVTALPGAGMAALLLPTISANLERQGHAAAVVEVQVSNLALLEQLYDEAQQHATLLALRDALTAELRGSDWLFHLTSGRLLILADLGRHHQGHVVLLDRLQQRLGAVPRAELTLRGAALHLPLPDLDGVLASLQLVPPLTVQPTGAAAD